MEPNASPGPKSNKSDDSQTSADAHDEASFRPADNINNDCLQPYAVTRCQQDDEVSIKMPENIEGNPHTHPHAVTYQKHDGIAIESADCDVVQPYAVKYEDETVGDSANNDGNPGIQRSAVNHQKNEEPFLGPLNCATAASNNINDVSTSPSSNDVLHALDPNPMYAAADIINNANDFLHALHPNPMYVPNARVPTAHGCDVKPEKITFGGQGKEPGKFLRKKDYGFGVAVSADNEIFVTDRDNKRVQVFSMNGTYLRLFPTVVPGESMTMFPYSVTLDVGPGYLWVLGKGEYEQRGSDMCYKGHVVQYSKNGQPIKKFDVSLIISFYPVIAMDVRNNKVIVGDGYTITMFDPNGSRFWSSNVRTAFGIGGVIWDKEGNILLTDGCENVQKYNQSGVKIFEFGTDGKANGQLDSPKGICLDSSCHIIVANTKNNRVDMFTRQGEFVRTIVDIIRPWGVAMGPCGELVVTSSHTYTVTIIPRHMVGP
ncbi:PREDICTED: E3 ubiquitin-protein ligase TRIM71-like [Branchiostoma belcheri]|uniref:E3 ubiquitin-protein ligase TRIM71-like n=1 Tax=Branchiostoma belcheri TaxID=7741 RepID=A0A6P4Z0A6_BRABE|nr:PREDICTED: E3 ubiquitin-protein ligase TRIM71-like [Branchiostoma belcheri]